MPRDQQSGADTETRVYVWDPALRLFHWALTGLVGFNLYTGLTGGLWQMDWHRYSGYAILTLVLFRLVWGLAGGRHARFRDFVRGPRTVLAYLRGDWSGQGHTPLGGWSVVAMLAALLVQAGSGLFASDDIFAKGPLADKVGEATVRSLTALHDLNGSILMALIGLHLTAVAFYSLRGRDLVRAMITGRRRVAGVRTATGARTPRLWAAPLILALAAGLVAALVSW